MTFDEIQTVSKIVIDALRPYIKEQVEMAVREIPYTIRQELHPMIEGEIRALARAAIKDSVVVHLEIKEKP